jgi:hypothetical protein
LINASNGRSYYLALSNGQPMMRPYEIVAALDVKSA